MKLHVKCRLGRILANHLAHIADHRDMHDFAQHLHRIVVHLGDMILHDAARRSSR